MAGFGGSRAWGVAGIVALLASTATAQEKGGGEGTRACAPGLQVGCACSGGAVTGIQVCRDDGTGYSACECPGAAGAPATGVASRTDVAAPPGDAGAIERGSLPMIIGGVVALGMGVATLGTGVGLYVQDESRNRTPAAGILLSGLGGAATLAAIPILLIGLVLERPRPVTKGAPHASITIAPAANGLRFTF